MKLTEHAELLAYDTVFWMAGLYDEETPVEQLGGLALEVGSKLRAMAIINLLTKGDSDLYYHNLIRSGLAWEKYLARLARESVLQDHHRACGRYAPWIDAVAAADWDLARRIITLLPSDFQKGHEYEDDYCFARLLHHLIDQPLAVADYQQLLDQFEAYVESPHHPRLAVCRALGLRDQKGFDEAFENLIHFRRREIDAAIARGQVEDPVIVADRLVFIEGLAILRFAEKCGLITEEEYQYCPSLARVPMIKPFPGE